MEGKIEVGDVFRYPNIMADLTAQAVNESSIRADDVWHAREFCQLVRKADPYHGIALPEPPAGYRLAKWGEAWTTKDAMWMFVKTWVPWPHSSNLVKWHRDDPGYSIFAIPLDQPSPLKSWQFREATWVAPEPKTLADVPNRTGCICFIDENHVVVCRVDDVAYGVGKNGDLAVSWHRPPSLFPFVRYLDPPPQKPLSLDDVPDGRVVKVDGSFRWKSGVGWFRLFDDGAILHAFAPSDFAITSYIAEFK